MIDYTYRYDPTKTAEERQPATSEEAREALVRGNRKFASWIKTCRGAKASTAEEFIVQSGSFGALVATDAHEYPTQKPFAVVLGCSDARVPTEMLFGQGFNDLFVVRNAGNVLSDTTLGSIDFTLVALKESVRVIVVLGHTGCGAVKGAVEAYLNPGKFWDKSNSPNLRTVFQRIFVAVRESDNMLRKVWGPDANQMPGYRDALVESAVCLNAAHSAFAIRQEVEESDIQGVDVLFAAYDVRTHQVCMPPRPIDGLTLDMINLAEAPRKPEELATLAHQIATSLKPN